MGFDRLRAVDPGYDAADIYTLQFAPEQERLTDGPVNRLRRGCGPMVTRSDSESAALATRRSGSPLPEWWRTFR